MIDKKTLADRLLSTVNGELGWNAATDDDDDVHFSSGFGFRIRLSNYAPHDPEYVQMRTGFRLSAVLEQAESPLELARPETQLRLLAGAARLTHKLKGVQIIVLPHDDMCIISVEVLAAGPDRLPSVDLLAGILPRMRTMLVAGVRDFHEDLILAGLEVDSTADRTAASGRGEQ